MIKNDLMKVHKNNPWDLRPFWSLGDFYRKLHAYRAASDSLNEVLKLDPTNPFVLYDLARIDLLSGKLRDGAIRLRKAAGIYPSIWPACRDLLFSYTDDYNITRELPPSRDLAHLNLGYYLLAAEQWASAEIEFRKAAALGPENPDNYRALGMLFFRAGDNIKSKEYYRRALELSPEDAQ